MNNWIMSMLTILSLMSFSNPAQAGSNTINGLVIGGGAGAVMGQAIGRNVESTVIGATIGGILGVAIASDRSPRRHRPGVAHHPPRGAHDSYFNHFPRHGAPQIFYYQPHPVYKHGKRRHHYKKNKHMRNRAYQYKCNSRHPATHSHKRW